jgi:CBS domain-containing protein
MWVSATAGAFVSSPEVPLMSLSCDTLLVRTRVHRPYTVNCPSVGRWLDGPREVKGATKKLADERMREEQMAEPQLVRDIMTIDVLTFRPDDKVGDAVDTLVRRDIGGAPVIDDQRRVVGILSDDDLIVQETQLHLPTVFALLNEVGMWPASVRRFEQQLRKAVALTVEEVMTKDAVTCAPEDTIEDAATLLHTRHLRRLPVVSRDGTLVGILARGDILRLLSAEPQEPPRADH